VYLPENSRVKDVRAQLVSALQQKKQFEQDYPILVAAAPRRDAPKMADAGGPSGLADKLLDENTRIAALQTKIQNLTGQLAYVRGRSAALDAQSSRISELTRTRKIEADNFNYFQTKQLQDSIDQNWSKNSNINVIQNPSAPSMDKSKLKKAEYGLGIAGILLGLGLAFLIEMYIDRTIKRPVDIESKLGVPLFLSIPYRNGKGNQRLLATPPSTSLTLRWPAKEKTFTLNGTKTTIGRGADSTVAIDDESVSEHHCEIFKRNDEVILKDLGSANGTYVDGQRVMEATLRPEQSLRVGNVEFTIEKHAAKAVEVSKKSAAAMPPWDPRHALRPFYDTLRDRLITYFEVKNLTHNPKLVALTSCGDSAGVTSTAAGLAAALSETGEGNVLLVDMNVERGAAHHFYKGHLSCGIDEALKKDKRDEARVQDNLYVVTESNSDDENSLPRVLPKRFTSLVPKLKASDYDYIIFDMPPMSQISITPRLARFMDMVMVVVESEKTDREVVQRAVNMLTEARANVGVVLNKRKQYVPKQLQQEL
jgi:Mrp family chromosome partitioning ATPase